MGCHVLSCFRCRAVMRCGRSGHGAAGSGPASPTFARAGRALPPGSFVSGFGAWRFSFPLPFPFHPPAAGGTLICAYPARAPAPLGARFAPARFARLIARARPRARTGHRAHPACWPNRGLFCAGANREGRAAPRGCRFLPPAPYCHWPSGNQVSSTKYFKKENNVPIRSPQSGLRRRAFTRARRGRGASAGGRRRCGGATRLR